MNEPFDSQQPPTPPVAPTPASTSTPPPPVPPTPTDVAPTSAFGCEAPPAAPPTPPVPEGGAADADLPMNNSAWFTRVLSFRGRITREEFALSHLLFPLPVAIAGFASNHLARWSEEMSATAWPVIFYPMLLLFGWFYLAQGAKRSHDTGRTGWLIFVPFYSVYLLFAPPQAAINRYGTPATVSSTVRADQVRAARTRHRGWLCACAWLLFSPLYAWLCWRWRLQNAGKRLLLFLLSPLVLTGVAVTVHQSRAEAAERHAVERARACLGAEVTGVDFDVASVDPDGQGGFRATLGAPLAGKTLAAIERLSSGQGSWRKGAEGDADEDYGYYLEDYGAPSRSAAAATTEPAVYILSVRTTLPGERQPVGVRLRVEEGDASVDISLPAARR